MSMQTLDIKQNAIKMYITFSQKSSEGCLRREWQKGLILKHAIASRHYQLGMILIGYFYCEMPKLVIVKLNTTHIPGGALVSAQVS